MFYNIFSNKKEEDENYSKVIVDFREKNSLVPMELSKLFIKYDFQTLEIGDYLIEDLIIERKTISDLKSSIIDKRIFIQIENLKQYNKYLLIIEGNKEELYDSKFIHANAIRGFLLSASLNLQVPIIYSENEKDTAIFISLISKKRKNVIHSNRFKKITKTKEEQIEFILEGFPNIGPKKAKELIKKFSSIKNIINANENELKEILGNKTQDFKNLID